MLGSRDTSRLAAALLDRERVMASLATLEESHHQVQQAIRPDAAALTIFGLAAALALLVLVGQGLAQMLSRTAPDIGVIRALGATRVQAALAAALPGLVAILGAFIRMMWEGSTRNARRRSRVVNRSSWKSADAAATDSIVGF